MPHSADDEAGRAVSHLWTLIEARGLIGTPAAQLLPRLADTLNNYEIPFVRDLPLSGFGHAQERINLFLAIGVAILLDVGTAAPNLARIQCCALPPAVRAIAVLTDQVPEAYPTGHSQRHAVNRKFLAVHRVASAR